MALDSRLLSAREALQSEVGDAWDALATSRGACSDIFDSHAWLAAWTKVAGRGVQKRLRVPAVFEGDRLVAALPLLVTRGVARWETPGRGYRPRFRPVLDGETPDPAALALLVQELARAGAREIELTGLPVRDPATAALAGALTLAGYRVSRRMGAGECLATVSGDWAAHRARFKSFDRMTGKLDRKAQRVGGVTLHRFGAPGEPAAHEGLARYLEVHAAGWKGPLGRDMESFRRELLVRAGERGWARLYVLEVAGVTTAAIIWFRTGPVAIGYSTVYDERFAPFGAGSVVMWRSQEDLFRSEPPGAIDLLPGRGPQKDELGPERPRLLTLHASRGLTVPYPVRRLRHVLPNPWRHRSSPPREPAVPPSSRARLHVAPSPPALPVPAATVARVELDPRLEIVLAVAGGHASPGQMKGMWVEGDAWYLVRSPFPALVRVGHDRARQVAREIVLSRAGSPDEVGHLLEPIAGLLGDVVHANLPEVVHLSPFPLLADGAAASLARS